MRISPEIKEFTKNTLILTLFFTVILHLSWGYIRPYLGLGANAENDANFIQINRTYLGSIATAASLNIGQSIQSIKRGNVDLSSGIISIAEVISSPKEGTTRLIGSNMLLLESYVNLLKTDIVDMLDQSVDRTKELDEHIAILKEYYTKTSERMNILAEQYRDLQALLKNAVETTGIAKVKMEEKYRGYDYEGVYIVIDDYVKAKNSENISRVYLAYVERFQKGYGILQGKNKKLLDTLINNREALIKRSTVVIPDSGSDLLKELNLVTTEAVYKESK